MKILSNYVGKIFTKNEINKLCEQEKHVIKEKTIQMQKRYFGSINKY